MPNTTIEETMLLVRLFDAAIARYQGYAFEIDDTIADYAKLTLKERFTSKPWRPWVSKIYDPRLHVILSQKVILVTSKTYDMFKTIEGRGVISGNC